MKEVSIIGVVGIPSRYGGFESLAENLASSKKTKFLVYCQESAYENKISNFKNAKLIYLPLKANGVQSILYDLVSILHSLFFRKNDLLLLGVSGAIFIPVIKALSKRKVVTNIDGLEWKREKWGPFAKKFLKFSEAIAVRFSDQIISDNYAITEYVKEFYNKKAVTIAYGGDHALTSDIQNSPKDYFLSICRVEPENNVHLILEAFSKTEKKLKFVGNWHNSTYGAKLRKDYENYSNIELLDPVYDSKKLFNLRSLCMGYIHGHSAGGTNTSLVEIMHFGINIFCFDCIYNRYTTNNKAYYFNCVTELIESLNLNAESNGNDMKEIASQKYTWDIVRKEYESLF